MTRAELHSIPGFHPASLLHAATYLRALMEPKTTPNEPTALIASGCETNGYLKAIRDLAAAASPQPPKVDPKPFQPYADPNQPKTENPNRP